MHRRFAPKAHRFLYRIFLFALDLDEVPELSRRLRFFSAESRNLYSFHDKDYLPTDEPLHNGSIPSTAPHASSSLKGRVLAFLAQRGTDLSGGKVLLVTLPRIFGYLFNPVSFYFCYDRSGTLVAALTEVTNTFKEMKPYFLGPDARTEAGAFHRRVPKYFYVSPYSDVDVEFDFQLQAPGEKLSIQIDDYQGRARTLTSTLTGARRPLTAGRLAWFTLKYPLLTLRIIALIHWHAFRLWLKRVPWFPKAARPQDQRSLHRPHASIAAAGNLSEVSPSSPVEMETP